MLALANRMAGCVRVSCVLAGQPFASVMLKVCVPAVRSVVPVPEYGMVPPLPVTFNVARPPWQAIGVVTVAVADRAAGCVIVMFVEWLQPRASVTVNWCGPAGRWKLPVPLYGVAPWLPVTVTVA